MKKNYFLGFQILILVLTSAPLLAQAKHDQKQALAAVHSTVSETDGFDVLSYRLELNFPFESSAFSGVAKMRIAITDPGSEQIRLDMEDLFADGVTVDGQSVPYEETEDAIQISMPDEARDTIQVAIAYHGAPEEHGFYFYDRCAYTMSEPQDARAWFPCHDTPGDKATAELVITVPKGVEVASIGLLRSRAVDPSGRFETFFWKTDFPVATYLFCVTMSREYTVWSDWYVTSTGDSIEMPYYVFRDDADKALIDVANMPDAIRIYSELFGPYPFEKYGTAEVTPFHVGGMEHQTMTTVNQSWFRGTRGVENGFVHELAHMWWGDAVTLADWPDIWLNESFATYSEALFFESFYGEESYKDKIRYCRDAYLGQSKQQDFPIFDPPDEELFNWGVIYNKGAVVLHLLRQEIGDDAFFKILPAYFALFKYGNVTTDDFQGVCEMISGADLDWFFDQWIYRAGYPELEYAWYSQSSPGGSFDVPIRISQVQDPLNAPIFRFPLDIRIYAGRDSVSQTVLIDQARSAFVFQTRAKADSVVFYPKQGTPMTSRESHKGPRLTEETPERFLLEQNFPNPFNGSTTLYFNVAKSEEGVPVRLAVHDTQGRIVREILSERMKSGAYWAVWNGCDSSGQEVASGAYLITLSTPEFSQTRKAVLNR